MQPYVADTKQSCITVRLFFSLVYHIFLKLVTLALTERVTSEGRFSPVTVVGDISVMEVYPV